MKRWTSFLLFTLFLFTGVTFAPIAAGEVTVNYWSRKTGADQAVWESMVKEFNKTHPGINVKHQVLPWGGAYSSRIRGSILAGSPPDIFDVSAFTPPMFFPYVETFTKDDLQQLGINEKDYLWSGLGAVTSQDRYHGVFLGVLPAGLYYNKEMFEKAGLDPKKPPRNLQEFIEYGKKLTKDTDGDGKIDQWGFMISAELNPGMFVWESILTQNGGSLLNQNRTKAAFNSKAGIDAVNILLDFSRKHKIAPPAPSDAASAFVARKSAMFMGGIWMIPSFKAKVPSSAAAPLPQLGSKRPATWSSADIYLFPKGGRKDAEKWKATMTYVKWVAGQKGQAFYAQAYLPARLEILNSPAIQQDPYMSQFAKAADSFFFPQVHKATEEIYGIVWSAIQGTFAGTTSAEKALAQAEEQANRILAKK